MTAATSETLLDVLPGDNDAVQQVEQWFRDYHATGDPAVRKRIILAHLGLADRLASRFRNRYHASDDDLVQAARVGLVAAVNRYDPDRANSFVVYAIVCITGELRRHLRDTSWRVHVARTVKERAIKVARTHSALTATLERAPTTEEIADHLGMSEGRVVEALDAIRTRSELSLDQPATEDGTISVGALLPAPASGVDLEDLLILPQLIGSLPELERRAVLLWFFDELKQHEIGPLLGCSQVHVSRLLRRALTSMREQLLA